MPNLEQLRELGLTPLEILTILALVVLVQWIKAREKARDKERAENRAETRERIDNLETKAEACEQDRRALNKKVDRLDESIRRFQACPSGECPMRR